MFKQLAATMITTATAMSGLFISASAQAQQLPPNIDSLIQPPVTNQVATKYPVATHTPGQYQLINNFSPFDANITLGNGQTAPASPQPAFLTATPGPHIVSSEARTAPNLFTYCDICANSEDINNFYTAILIEQASNTTIVETLTLSSTTNPNGPHTVNLHWDIPLDPGDYTVILSPEIVHQQNKTIKTSLTIQSNQIETWKQDTLAKLCTSEPSTLFTIPNRIIQGKQPTIIATHTLTPPIGQPIQAAMASLFHPLPSIHNTPWETTNQVTWEDNTITVTPADGTYTWWLKPRCEEISQTGAPLTPEQETKWFNATHVQLINDPQPAPPLNGDSQTQHGTPQPLDENSRPSTPSTPSTGRPHLGQTENGNTPHPEPTPCWKLPDFDTLYGESRHETTTNLMRVMLRGNRTKQVFLSRDDNPFDTQAVLPYAVNEHIPIVQTNKDVLSHTTRDFLSELVAPGGTVMILGGHAAISPGIETELQQLGYKTARYGGPTRIETMDILSEMTQYPVAKIPLGDLNDQILKDAIMQRIMLSYTQSRRGGNLAPMTHPPHTYKPGDRISALYHETYNRLFANTCAANT